LQDEIFQGHVGFRVLLGDLGGPSLFLFDPPLVRLSLGGQSDLLGGLAHDPEHAAAADDANGPDDAQDDQNLCTGRKPLPWSVEFSLPVSRPPSARAWLPFVVDLVLIARRVTSQRGCYSKNHPACAERFYGHSARFCAILTGPPRTFQRRISCSA
jgi:hypothetical protein